MQNPWGLFLNDRMYQSKRAAIMVNMENTGGISIITENTAEDD